MKLVEIQPILQNILNMLQHSMNIEGSIIDNDYNMLAYTDNYLKFKGAEVHTPFIKKVFELGEIIVSQPGQMPICKGCRFQDKCPATIEILHSIQHRGEPVGSLSISSFNSAKNCIMDKDIKAYKKSVLDTTLLIESILDKHTDVDSVSFYSEMLRTAIDHSNECIICVDEKGDIVQYNEQTRTLFNDKPLVGQRITEILPENKLNKIISKKYDCQILTQINNKNYYVSIKPILWDNLFYGAILCFVPSQDHERRKKHPTHYIQFDLNSIIGNAKSMTVLKDKIQRLSSRDSSVLIIGETGTGKELVARAIHSSSTRSEHPFVSVNCAAVPETLLESEFFGYDEGAFTGAKRSGKHGLFELADQGTLFLDEIGDMPLPLQAKLLRVLQNGEIRKLGGDSYKKIDVRILAATNQDLLELVDAGSFRRDLFYRLDVIRLNIPPLRERKEDIPALAEYFLDQFCNHFSQSIYGFEQDAIEQLLSYSWPGNIRELENVIEYVANFETESIVKADTLLEKLYVNKFSKEKNLKEQIEDFERQVIEEALLKYGNDVNGKKRIALELDIGLRTLYRKFEALGMSTKVD